MPIYDIRGIKVEFPFEAYECQKVYMEKVIQSLQERKNALLESPTGTGKTMCLLCACLSWRKHQIKEMKKVIKSRKLDEVSNLGDELASQPPRIIYASRTHSQLSQVIKELKRSNFKVKTSVLGSRAQLCIHPEVSLLKGETQNQLCRSKVTARKCSYYDGVESAKQETQITEEIVDIEELVNLGKYQDVCPFYLERELEKTAEIIFMPYNYLVDSSTRVSLNIDIENSILIFDEAHNLESVCCDSSSFEISVSMLQKCLKEIKYCIHLSQKQSVNNFNNDTISIHSLKKLEETVEKLKGMINDIDMNEEIKNSNINKTEIFGDKNKEQGIHKPGSFLFDIFKKVNIDEESINVVFEVMEASIEMYTQSKAAEGPSGMMDQNSSLSTFNDILKRVFVFGSRDTIHSFYIHIESPNDKKQQSNFGLKTKEDKKLSCWCFNAGVAMDYIKQSNIHNMILTSGTLSPLDSFAMELNTDFPIRLENGHVISNDQIWVGVVPKGPTQQILNSSFKTRSDMYFNELGLSLVNFARIIPNGELVFFPSYDLLQTCVNNWKKANGGTSVFESISKYKQIIVEPREAHQFNEAMKDFYKKVKENENKNESAKGGAMFFGVSRGKVSEGIDFADENGRGVVICGLPFPSVTDPKVRLKRQFLDEAAAFALSKGNKNKLKGNDWYQQQSSRAVNQAIGRVIRHRLDFGAIILCDERFANKSNQIQLSTWLHPVIQVFPNFGDAVKSLSSFFKKMSSFFHPPMNILQSNTNVNQNMESKNSRKEIEFSDAKTYLKKVKKKLDKKEYQYFISLLKEFKQTSQLSVVVKQLKDLFSSCDPSDPSRLDLLNEFISFIPENKRESYRELLNSTTSNKINSNVHINSTVASNTSIQSRSITTNKSVAISSANQRPISILSMNKTDKIDAIDVDVIEEAVKVVRKPQQVISVIDDPYLEVPSEVNAQKRSTYDLVTGQNTLKQKSIKKLKLSENLNTNDQQTTTSTTTSESFAHAPLNQVNSVSSENKSKDFKEDQNPRIVCAVCRDTALDALTSKCGHVCCSSCWESVLSEKLECPVCRTRTRHKQLTKLYLN